MPNMTNVLTNALSSVTGKIAKAVIKVRDSRPADPDRVKALEAVMAGGASKGGNAISVSGLDSAGVQNLQEAGGNVSSAAAGAAAATGGVRDNLNGNKLSKLQKDTYYNKMFEVQFNPNTLQITGYGGSNTAIQNFNNVSSKELSVTTAPVNMQFSVRLIFDQMILSEAFPSENFNLNASRLMDVGGNLINKAIGGGGVNDVETIVEGFIAALRNPNTSRVAFCWGDLQYAGLLQTVNANYTLFDATSKPVRAEVDLSIYLRDHNVKTTASGFDLGYWRKAYKAAFEESNSYAGSGTSLARNIPGINKLVN